LQDDKGKGKGKGKGKLIENSYSKKNIVMREIKQKWKMN